MTATAYIRTIACANTQTPKNKHAVRLRHICRMSFRQHTYRVVFAFTANIPKNCNR